LGSAEAGNQQMKRSSDEAGLAAFISRFGLFLSEYGAGFHVRCCTLLGSRIAPQRLLRNVPVWIAVWRLGVFAGL
jgi:hypothetical protein